MNLEELFKDKISKPKDKIASLSKALLENNVNTEDLVKFAAISKDPVKASCIEALEFSSKKKPEIITKKVFEFVTETLNEKAPRIKWESAKVIGNTVQLFPKKLDAVIVNLLNNSEHSGTVVRWSTAFALGEIVKLNTSYNKELLPTIETIIKREEKNSIKKIYLDAFKKVK